MRDFALKAGVPSEDIFMDHAGFSTYDSVYRAGEVFQVEKAVIVTQRYHLYRALYSAGPPGAGSGRLSGGPQKIQRPERKRNPGNPGAGQGIL